MNILSRKDRNNNSTCFHNVQLSSENSESKLISLYFSISQVSSCTTPTTKVQTLQEPKSLNLNFVPVL